MLYVITQEKTAGRSNMAQRKSERGIGV